MEFRVQGETAIIKYLKMGGLKTTEIYFLSFGGLRSDISVLEGLCSL
jgi:hypothetical protein